MKRTNTAERLKAIMQIKNISQADIVRMCRPFCEEIGAKMGSNDVSQYVTGKVQPKQKKLTVLALGLNVSEAWLMGLDVPMERDTWANTENIEAGDVIICHRDGKTTKKRLTNEQIAMLQGLLDAIPDVDE